MNERAPTERGNDTELAAAGAPRLSRHEHVGSESPFASDVVIVTVQGFDGRREVRQAGRRMTQSGKHARGGADASYPNQRSDLRRDRRTRVPPAALGEDQVGSRPSCGAYG